MVRVKGHFFCELTLKILIIRVYYATLLMSVFSFTALQSEWHVGSVYGQR
jgi:hypothetical protein